MPPFDPKQPLDRFLLEVTRGARPSLKKLRPELPSTIDDWVEKALAADPTDRFATVGKMWATLRAVAEMPVQKTPTVKPADDPWEVEIDVDIEVEVATLRGEELARKLAKK